MLGNDPTTKENSVVAITNTKTQVKQEYEHKDLI